MPMPVTGFPPNGPRKGRTTKPSFQLAAPGISPGAFYNGPTGTRESVETGYSREIWADGLLSLRRVMPAPDSRE